MVGKRSYSALASGTLTLWLASCSTAQGNQTTEDAACPTPDASYFLHNDGPVNATGSIPFKFAGEYQNKKDWYLSLAYNATDPENQYLYPSVSVPDDAGDLRGCFHMFAGQNKTSEGSPGVASESCNGVLEESCINGLLAAAAQRRCQPLLTEAQAACGDDFSNFSLLSNDILWGNDTCRKPDPPGIDLPDGYITTLAGTGILGNDDSDGDFVRYDLTTKQTFPFIVTGYSGSEGGSSDVQVICLSPSDIQDGSRDPPPSAAMRTDSRRAGSIALVGASLAGLALVVM